MNDDRELLRCYCEEGSQSAFTALVQRHIDLVYSVALRRTGGDSHLARDVAQQVFTTVARHARQLAGHAVLSAWLHTATRNAALNLMISEQRRKARERLAAAEPPAGSDPAWEQLRPLLDSAIDELTAPDRAAVVLRFLEKRSFAQIAAALGVSEDAARMRTDRALEKLRAALSRRGVTSSAAAVGTLVSGHSLVGAPAGLAAAIAQHALAAAGTGLLATFLSLMTTKTIATALVSGALAFAAGSYFGLNRAAQEPLPPAPELPEHSRTIASLRNEVAQLKAARDTLAAANTKIEADLRAAHATPPPRTAPSPTPEADPLELGQRRAIMNNLRQLGAAIDFFYKQHRRPPTSLDEIVGETKLIRQLSPVAGENYRTITLVPDQPLSVVTANGTPVILDRVPQSERKAPAPPSPAALRASELMEKAEPAMLRALAVYKTANPGKNPPNPEALLPYFATPQEGADFVEAVEAQKAARQ